MKIRKITKRLFVQHVNLEKNPTEEPISMEEDKRLVFCIIKSFKKGNGVSLSILSFVVFNRIFSIYRVTK